LGCPHFAGIFALGASVDFLTGVGMANIQERALSMNRILTDRLVETGLTVLSPLGSEDNRSAETLVAIENPAQVVTKLALQGVIVTEKPEGIRVATDFFNNDQDIERLIGQLTKIRDA
jgi:selenocysteine lyase/cysteine desulfurase